MFLATKLKSGALATVHRTHTPTQSISVYDILETLGYKQSRLIGRFITFIIFSLLLNVIFSCVVCLCFLPKGGQQKLNKNVAQMLKLFTKRWAPKFEQNVAHIFKLGTKRCAKKLNFFLKLS